MSQRVALVGLGNAGMNLHLPALAGLPGVTLAGVCDLDAERRRLVSERWKAPAFASFDALLATQPDVVVIGTPPATHADYCLRSLAAGVNVICEKPFVASVAEAERVIDAAARAGRRVAVNHEFREMPIFRALRTAVRQSPTGKVTFAQVWQVMDLPPWSEPGWRGHMARRTLYEAGVHLVDFLLALFQERPVAVSAIVSSGYQRRQEGDAIVVATLEFSGGRLAQLLQHRLCKGETQYFDVRADTPEASLRASFGGRARLTTGLYRSTRPHLRLELGVSGIAWQEVGHQRTILARNPKRPEQVATRALFEKTLDAFHDGRRPPASAEDGRDAIEVVAACYHAAATGRRVSFDGPDMPAIAAMCLETSA